MKVKRLTAALLAAAITVSSIAPEAFAEISGAGGMSTVNESADDTSTDPASGGSDKAEESGKTVSASEPGEGESDYTYNALDDGTIEITGYSGSAENIVIPAQIDGKSVTRIGNNAFEKSSAKEIVIPDSVTDIEQYAFEGCTSLSDITLPDSLTSIGLSAFESCTALTDIALPDSLTYIDGFAFANCTSLKTVTVPASVTFIGGWAFGYYFEDGNIDARVAFDDFTINYTKHTAGHLYAIENGFTDEGCLKYTVSADGALEIYKYVGNDTIFEIPAEIGGKKVTSIGYSAFENRTSLTSVTIPDSVTDIGFQAFHNCTSLKSVTIPASVTTIGNYAFGYFYDANKETKIDGFTINYTKNTAGHLYAAQNGFTDEACLINELQDDGTVIITKYAGNDTVFEIPSEIDGKKVTGIGNRAFQNSTSLTNATIPDGVTHIDECAFQGCSSLTDIALPDSLAIIDSYAFNNCAMLTSITIPNGVTRIEWATFYGCSALTDLVLPDSVTYIGYKVFFDCPSLKTVTIPASVTDIGEYAFGYHDDDNWNLAKIDGFKINYTKNTWGHYYAKQNGFSDEPCLVAELNEDGTTLKISKYAGNDTEYVIPSEIDGKKVTSIGNDAFRGNTSLISVTIPGSIKDIGDNAFSDCSSLESVTISDGVERILYRAFYNCTSLKTVTVPASVTYIDNNALGYYSDDGGININKIDGFTINYTKYTHGHLYATANGFTDEGYLYFNILDDDTVEIKRYIGNDTVFEIPAEIDGKQITSIGNYAFLDRKSLTSVTIPDSVTIIRFQAFHNCPSLKTVTIPASVTTIGDYAFGYFDDEYQKTKIDGFKINYTKNTAGHRYAFENGFTDETCLLTEIQEDGTVKITKYCGNDTSFVIPAEIDGKPVTSIGYRAFADSTLLTSITIPDSVKYIEMGAFASCTSLTDIVLPASLITIDTEAFRNCTSLTSVTIPDGVTDIGSYAFASCSALTKISLPDSVVVIGDRAFFDCPLLKSVTVPASVTDIGEYAFGYHYDDDWYYTKTDGFKINYTKSTVGHLYATQNGFSDETCLLTEQHSGSSSLKITKYAGYDTEYAIPAEIDGKKITEIGYNAFENCTSLTSVTIPDGVTSIGVEAFNRCTSLMDIVLPDSLTNIGNGAFANCTSLKSVTIPAGVTNIGEYAFGYYYDDNFVFTKVDGFKINYTKNTEGHYYATENGFSDETCLITYVVENSDTLAIEKYTGHDKTYVIPSEIDGKKITRIDSYAFKNRTSLTSVTIPDGVTIIGAQAFNGCTALTDINIPDGVTRIGSYAFNECSALADIKIPDSVTAIGMGAFNDTAILNNQDPTAKYVGKWLVYYDKTKTSASIKADTVGIADIAFYGCKIENIVIPDKVKYIGNNAFSSCSWLESVVIPDSVITIGEAAFISCDSLASVSIPASVESIEKLAFGFDKYNEKNDDFKIEYVKQTEGHRYAAENGFTDEIFFLTEKLDNGSLRVIGYAGKASSVTIPAEINGKSVTELGDEEYRFRYSGTLKSLTVPDSVIKINYKAFISSKLTTVVLPEKLTDIGIGAFAVTPVIKKQKTDIKYIGSAVISCDTEAETLTIGDNVTTIASNAFVNGDNYDGASNCGNLKSLIISRNVKYIGEHAFGYYLDEENNYRKVEDFTIKCYCNSAAEQYAKDNGIAYELIADGHNVVIDKAVEPTCTKTGLTEGKHCSVCNAVIKAQETVPAKGHKYVDTVVKPTYTAKGYTLHKCSVCGTSYKDTYTAKLTLAKVTGVKLGGRAADALRINWTKNANADGYIVEMYQGNKWVRVAKITSNNTTTLRKAGLKAGTAYKFRVKAYKMSGKTAVYGAYSATVAARTNPSVIKGAKLTGRAADALRINWSKNASADGYIVEMYQGNKWVRVAKITSNSTTTFRKAGLKASSVYKFRVRAYKMSGKTALYGNYSATVTARTNPSIVKGVKIGGKAKDALRVNWTKNSSAQGYIVEMYKGGKWVRVAKITNGNTTTYRKAGLAKNTAYKFRVCAYHMSGKTALYGNYGSVSGKTAAK